MRKRWCWIVLGMVGLCAGCRNHSAASPQAKWQDAANWKQIRPAMSQDQVREILGEPTRVDAGTAFTEWVYGDDKGGRVTFAGRMVKDWKPPA